MRRNLNKTLAAIGLVYMPVAGAQSPHVHGLANADVALIGESLEISIAMPTDSLVGFEHAPENDQQRTAISDAKALLANPNQLFAFSNRECRLDKSTVTFPDNWSADNDHYDHKEEHHHDHDHEHEDKHKHDHEDEHKHGHEDEHKHGHEDEHKHGHEDEHKHGHEDEHNHDHEDDHHHDHKDDHSDHSDVEGLYSFTCKGESEVVISVALFKRFPRLEEVKVNWLSDSQQSQVELTAEQAEFEIK